LTTNSARPSTWRSGHHRCRLGRVLRPSPRGARAPRLGCSRGPRSVGHHSSVLGRHPYRTPSAVSPASRANPPVTSNRAREHVCPEARFHLGNWDRLPGAHPSDLEVVPDLKLLSEAFIRLV
jgi:hypothetical protein